MPKKTRQPENSAADEQRKDALNDAKRRMTMRGEGETSEEHGDSEEHDEQALQDAEERMLLRDDRS